MLASTVTVRIDGAAPASTTGTTGPLAVVWSRPSRAEDRWVTCDTTSTTARTAAAARTIIAPRRKAPLPPFGLDSGMLSGSLIPDLFVKTLVQGVKRGRRFAQKNIGDWHQEQGRQGCQHQPADHGAAQGGILLAGLA